MELDDLGIKPDILSVEHGLYKPMLDRSVAGILPELIRGIRLVDSMDDQIMHSILDGKVEFIDLRNRLNELSYENIIFIVADAVGASHLGDMGGLFADNMLSDGLVASTVFPSMTATVMTSLTYGKYPSDHGLVGYNIYNEHIDGIWNALNLKYLDGEDEKMITDTHTVDKIVTGKPIIDDLREKANLPVSFVSSDYVKSPGLLDVINPSFKPSLYGEIEDGAKQIVHELSKPEKNRFIAFYYPYADHYGHVFGPESEEYEKSIRGVEQIVQQLLEHPKVKDGSTAIVVTADHGQSQIDHDISRWMDRDRWQYHRENGVTLSSSGRVLHAYSNGDEKGRDLLEKLADGRGLVIDNAQAMELSGCNLEFKQRMGDYVMIMEYGYLHDVPEIVRFDDEDSRLNGQHGSMTKEELFVPVAIFGK